jgi:hypothetical protein
MNWSLVSRRDRSRTQDRGAIWRGRRPAGRGGMIGVCPEIGARCSSADRRYRHEYDVLSALCSIVTWRKFRLVMKKIVYRDDRDMGPISCR